MMCYGGARTFPWDISRFTFTHSSQTPAFSHLSPTTFPIMASSSSKRPTALSLAEQLGCPTGYDRYEIKLPVYNKTPYHSHLECSCRNTGNGSTCVRCAISISFAKTKEKALPQAKKRWAVSTRSLIVFNEEV